MAETTNEPDGLIRINTENTDEFCATSVTNMNTDDCTAKGSENAKTVPFFDQGDLHDTISETGEKTGRPIKTPAKKIKKSEVKEYNTRKKNAPPLENKKEVTLRTVTNNKKEVISGTKKFSCRICFKNFSQKVNAINHEKSIHTKVFEYVCQKCKHSFVKSSDLTRHYNSVHLKIRFMCDICPKSFTHKCVLNKHKKVKHTSE